MFYFFTLAISYWIIYEIHSMLIPDKANIVQKVISCGLLTFWISIKQFRLSVPFETIVFSIIVMSFVICLIFGNTNENWLFYWVELMAVTISASLLIGYFFSLRNDFADGKKLLHLSLTIAWTNDLVASFVGRKIGKKKLAPKLSPRKTWEGAIGGTLAGSMVGFLISQQTLHYLVQYNLIIAGMSILSSLGDLTVSMLKRFVGIRHSGSIFGGFGGITDKMSSVLFVSTGIYLLRALL